jgi:hypothetical protein
VKRTDSALLGNGNAQQPAIFSSGSLDHPVEAFFSGQSGLGDPLGGPFFRCLPLDIPWCNMMFFFYHSHLPIPDSRSHVSRRYTIRMSVALGDG